MNYKFKVNELAENGTIINTQVFTEPGLAVKRYNEINGLKELIAVDENDNLVDTLVTNFENLLEE